MKRKIKFNGEVIDMSMLLVSAERYALGRRTYIVDWTCEIIKRNVHLLTEKDKLIMIRDIEEAYSYGDKCDEINWKNLLSFLKKEVDLSERK